MNSFGNQYKITIIGSSHGNLVGVIIDGIPAGIELDLDNITIELQQRKPGQSTITTTRKEEDELKIRSGLSQGFTNGEPLYAYVENLDVKSDYYEEIKYTPRPGHADYPAFIKYGGHNDYRGGGRFSGRMTIGLVIAGSIAKQILSKYQVNIISYTKSIGSIDTEPEIYDPFFADDVIYASDNIVRVAEPSKIDEMINYIKSIQKESAFPLFFKIKTSSTFQP